MRILLALAFCVALLGSNSSANADAFDDAKAAFEKGFYGFAGEIRPFNEPVDLRYRPFPKMRLETNNYSTLSRSVDVWPDVFRLFSSIEMVDQNGRLEWSIAVLGFGPNDLFKSLQFEALFETDGLGRDLHFTEYCRGPNGEMSACSTGLLAETVAGEIIRPRPAQPVGTNDVIYRTRFKEYGWDGFLKHAEDEVGIPTARARGLSTIGDREVLIAEISGRVEISDGDDTVPVTVSGFDAIDINTGISFQSAVRLFVPYNPTGQKALDLDAINCRS